MESITRKGSPSGNWLITSSLVFFPLVFFVLLFILAFLIQLVEEIFTKLLLCLISHTLSFLQLKKEGRRNEYEMHKLLALNQRQKMVNNSTTSIIILVILIIMYSCS